MSTKSEAKKPVATENQDENMLGMLQQDKLEVIRWALLQAQPDAADKFIHSSQGGITIRMFGKVDEGKSGEVTVKLTKSEALMLLADGPPMSTLQVTAERVLPFVEYPTVMLSTNKVDPDPPNHIPATQAGAFSKQSQKTNFLIHE